MALFVLQRNYTHGSLRGHMITFRKGEPTYVPPECHREVIQIGAIPVDASGEVDLLEPETPVPVEPTAEERTEQLIAAFELLEERNRRKDFTGQGIPSITALAAIVDFDVTRREVEDLWRQYRENKGTEQ